LATSQITLNRHVEEAEGYANNMRLFEGTGLGSLVITDRAPNLDGLFHPAEEIETYSSGDDLIEKIETYLAAPEELARVAAAGQARTLREHTYENRVRELAGMLEEAFE
jgi:spore maturation protein CgeB